MMRQRGIQEGGTSEHEEEQGLQGESVQSYPLQQTTQGRAGWWSSEREQPAVTLLPSARSRRAGNLVETQDLKEVGINGDRSRGCCSTVNDCDWWVVPVRGLEAGET